MTDMEILYNAYRDSGLQTNEEMEKYSDGLTVRLEP